MGMNTPAIILNDAINYLQDDPQFNQKLYRAILETNAGQPVDVSIGNHCNGMTVFPCQHADFTQIYALGGNYATKLGSIYNGGVHHTPEAQLQLLKDLAELHGFRLVKRSK